MTVGQGDLSSGPYLDGGQAPPVKILAPLLSDLGYLAFLDYQRYIAKKCAGAIFTMLDTSCLLAQSVLLHN